MIKTELTKQEAIFLENLLNNVSGLNSLEPEDRWSANTIISSILEKVKVKSINNLNIF